MTGLVNCVENGLLVPCLRSPLRLSASNRGGWQVARREHTLTYVTDERRSQTS